MPDATAQTTQTAEESTVEGPIRASADARDTVERMSEDLGLWQTDTEAALFLAALAAAKDAEPADVDEIEDLEEIGSTEDVGGARDELAVLGLLTEASPSPGAVREHQLPGWIEAGAGILDDRLGRADEAEAAAEVADLLDEVGQDED